MSHSEHVPPKQLSKEISLIRQILILLLVVVLLVLLVLFVDTFQHDVGKDWSQSLIIRMIVERREHSLIFE